MRLYLKRLLLIICALCSPLMARATTAPAISITPGYSVIGTSGTLQYRATVTGLTNTAVTWAINGIVGGNATLGTISPSGLYTAPATPPNSTGILIEALASNNSSMADVYLVVEQAGPPIASVTPNPIPLSTYTITVKGTGFEPGASVYNGSALLATTYVSPTTLIAVGYQQKTGIATLSVKNNSTLLGPVFAVPFAGTATTATVSVSHANATIAVGRKQQFTAAGATSWSATAGTISSTGMYAAPASLPSNTNVTIAATGPSGSGSAAVTLVPAATQTISPTATTVTVGKTQQFTSAGATSWSATEGTINSSGLYTAPATMPSSASVTVTATGPNGSASAAVTLSAAPAVALTISPSVASVTLGQTQQFTSTGATSWAATEGSISSTGLYTAPATTSSVRSATVTASNATSSATATVTLVVPASQTISPTSASVTLGQTQQFTSSGATSWTATAGTVSSSGLYTAPTTMPSSASVSVTATGPNGSATATVSLASAATQAISPTSVSLTAGLTQQFTSAGATSWTATLGTISSTGLYTAPATIASSTSAAITATGPAGTATATVQLTAAAAAAAVTAAPSWTQITVPSSFAANGNGKLFPLSDGNVYAATLSGSSGSYVNTFYKASMASVVTGSPTWTAIGTASAGSGTEYYQTMTATPNGTIMIALSNEGGSPALSDVLSWNGLTGSSAAWSLVSGYTGASTSMIYNFTTDSAGYTYFSPAWGGDVWRNNAPNSTAFTRQVSSLYTTFGDAAGGVYQGYVWNLGSGDQYWGCGEGELINSNLAFTSATQYLGGSGYTGNCTNLAHSATTILAMRTSTFPNDLTSIDTSTLAVTNHPCTTPRTGTTCPSVNTNVGVGGLQFLNGSDFVWSYRDENTGNQGLVLSTDNGNTWNDMTAMGSLGSNCTGANLDLQSEQSYQPANYVFARCQSGKYYWVYGAIGSSSQAVTVAQTISPTAASVVLGQTQQFTSSGATSWRASAGTISSTGLYTAPTTMPSSSTVTVTVTGSNGSATATVSLTSAAATQTISPTSVSLTAGQTQQFISSGATSWTASVGSISSTGLYTAPATLTTSTAAVVTATGTSGSATATVVLTAAATTTAALGNVSITTESPLYGWQVIPGATRRIHATVTNGSTNEVTWTYTTSGGATATLTPAPSPNILGAFVDVTVGSVGSACTNVGTATAPVFSSAATVTLTATSVDDKTKSTTVPINVCSPTVSAFVSPFNVRLYSGQTTNLQSWVWGAVNDNVVWTITQPSGGNGQLIAPPAGGSASTNRDAVFSATVAGDYTVTATSVANSSVSASATISVDSAAMPSYTVTPNHTEPVDCSVDPAEGGTTYDVGAGHPYAMIANAYVAIGSNVLNPGTTIRLFNTDTTGTNPTHYNEYLRIDGQGTQTQPIRIVGCADSKGNLPVMDASNATSYSPTDNSVAAQISGLYQIGLHHSNGFAVYPTINSPSYVIIEGLAFRNAYPTTDTGGTSNYYAPGSSTATQWGNTASCIRPYEGNHVTVRGNDMEDCSFGILADFNGNNGWGGFFGDFDLEGNYFTNIGAANQSEHMAYVQGFRQVIQGNVFDQLKSVSAAGELKMRGVAEVVRYNFFNTSTNSRTIDFVEEQDSNMYMSFLGYYYTPSGSESFHTEYPNDPYTPDMIAAADEAWHKAYAYGNVVNFGPNTPTSQAPIHFFGDQSPYVDENTNPPVRVGNLFDYSNTFYNVGGGTSSPPNFNLVDTMENQDNQIRWEWPFLTIANNAIYSGPLNTTANQGFQWSTVRSDVYTFGTNWISSNWGNNTQSCTLSSCWAGTGWPYYQETTQYMDGGNLPAHITGLSNLITGGSTVPFSTTTFIPTAGGGLVGAGSALPSTVSNMPVRFQITAPTYALTPRANPLTLGAHD